MGRLTVLAAMAAAALLTGFGVGSGPARAADPVFQPPTIDSSFGQGITVTQPVWVDAPPHRVELLLSTSLVGSPLVIEVPPPTRAGLTTLRYTIGIAEGHILPNTPVTVRWRVTPTQGAVPITGPQVRDVVQDDRFDWQTVRGDIVRVHWYEGSRAFADRALRICL